MKTKKNSTIVKIQKAAKVEMKSELKKSPEIVIHSVPQIKPVEVQKFTYKTISSKLVKENFSSFLKSESKEVNSRIKERGIKVSDIVKISKQVQHQLVGSKIRSIANKFYITMKDNSLKVLNFSEYKKV